MKCLEEKNKLEILRDLLEGEAYGGDGEELGDVEEERKDNDREDMGEGEYLRCSVEGSLLEMINCEKKWLDVLFLTW